VLLVGALFCVIFALVFCFGSLRFVFNVIILLANLALLIDGILVAKIFVYRRILWLENVLDKLLVPGR